MTARLVSKSGSIEFYSPYDSGLVGGIKAIPYTDRAWNPDKKCWVVANKHKQHLIDLSELYLGSSPQLHGDFKARKKIVSELFRIEYIGALKDRGNGELSAMGAIAQLETKLGKYSPAMGLPLPLDWKIIFSESVLRQYFEGGGKTSIVMTTFYSTLATRQNATQQEIKKAWRQMSRRYHPDVNKDDDASEMMIKINKAYEILRDPQQRKRYDAGLKLSATVYQPQKPSMLFEQYWKPPIRCGFIMCQGQWQVGRFIVDEIKEWLDIKDGDRTLVTSWDNDANSLIRSWI